MFQFICSAVVLSIVKQIQVESQPPVSESRFENKPRELTRKLQSFINSTSLGLFHPTLSVNNSTCQYICFHFYYK